MRWTRAACAVVVAVLSSSCVVPTPNPDAPNDLGVRPADPPATADIKEPGREVPSEVAPPTVAARRLAAVAGPIRETADFSLQVLEPNDDGYSERVPLPFTIRIGSETFDSLFVNNNGNVTFDRGLSDYTPVPFSTLDLTLIAPFWADVDTRAENSGSVSYGSGSVDGSPAFAVNWTDVGFYNQNASPINDFQLLLISRGSNGDTDVEFNYRTINWETGDASWGVGGLGGASARVGIVDASGGTIRSHEEVGSAEPGAFLDSNAQTALSSRISDGTRGRIIYRLRDGWTNSSNDYGVQYLALGDSFSSGEGAPPFDPNSNALGGNQCHRSEHAYARQFASSRPVPAPILRACSGAIIANLFGYNTVATILSGTYGNISQAFEDIQVRFGQGAPLLGDRTELVTLSIGGNDTKFAEILTDCVLSNPNCDQAHADEVTQLIRGLPPLYSALWQRITSDAPNADVYVLGYPRFFPNQPTVRRCAGVTFFANGLQINEQRWINSQITALNSVIKASTSRFPRLRYVDVERVFDDHHLCEPGNQGEWMNALVPADRAQSFHPNALGQLAFANALGRSWDERNAGWLDLVPGNLASVDLDVASGASRATFRTTFAASSIPTAVRAAAIAPGVSTDITLVSPSGRLITPSSAAPDVTTNITGDGVTIAIDRPEAGTWRLGVMSDAGGIRVNSDVVTERAANEPPVLTVSDEGPLTGSAPFEVVLDADASDPDGEEVEITFDSGEDHEPISGGSFTHTYTAPGHYRIAVAADDGTDTVLQLIDVIVSEPEVCEAADSPTSIGGTGYLADGTRLQIDVRRIDWFWGWVPPIWVATADVLAGDRHIIGINVGQDSPLDHGSTTCRSSMSLPAVDVGGWPFESGTAQIELESASGSSGNMTVRFPGLERSGPIVTGRIDVS